MNDHLPSTTAQMTAYCRWHHVHYDEPLIFEDRLSGEILGDEGRCAVESMLLGGLARVNPAGAAAFPSPRAAIDWLMQAGASSPIVLARARFAEEQLALAIAAGVSQYVILGAGLDTFTFRRPDLLEHIAVFEVDHPATQAYKCRRIAELGWPCPDRLHFVAIDFVGDSLSRELATQAPFDPGQLTFFSWLGVSYYLKAAEIEGMLREIARLVPAGSGLVFDYLDSVAYDECKAAPRVARMITSVQEIGEPMLSAFNAHELTAELADCGFVVTENLGPCDIHRRYFMGRTDHHRACEHLHLACALVR